MTDADKRAFAREYGDWIASVPVANQDWAGAIFSGALDETRKPDGSPDVTAALNAARAAYAKNPRPEGEVADNSTAEQPRDEHGRWTSAGHSELSAPDHLSKVKQLVELSMKRYLTEEEIGGETHELGKRDAKSLAHIAKGLDVTKPAASKPKLLKQIEAEIRKGNWARDSIQV